MFTIHTPQTAPEGSREALAALERNIGFIPNLAGTIAGSPVALKSFVAMQTALRGSRLTGLEREVVGITVSRFNESAYSLAAHSAFAARAGASPEVVAALRTGEPLASSRLETVRSFTEALLEGGEPSGLDAEEALEVITQLAYTTLANLTANLASTPIDDAFAVPVS